MDHLLSEVPISLNSNFSFKCNVKGVKTCWFTSGRSERESKRTFWEVTSRERVIQDAITPGPPRSS